jgi:hypothetical protein
MDQTRTEEVLKDYLNLQKAMETLGTKLTKAEKQIFALEEGLTALAQRLRQLEEAVENWGLDGRE